jgi:hypothetical protein
MDCDSIHRNIAAHREAIARSAISCADAPL